MKETERDSGGQDRIALLQTFVRVAQARSFSAAAQQLGLTQPTVSRRVQVLEAQLGVRLVQRSTRGLRLTEEGARCLALADGLVDRWQQLEEALGLGEALPGGRLRIRVPHAFGQAALVDVLAGFLEAHPGVTAEWMLDDTLPDFSREDVDCAILVGAVSHPNLVAQVLGQVARIVVAAPTLIERLGGELGAEPQAWATAPWLSLNTFYTDEVLLHRRSDGVEQRLQIQPRMGTNSLFALGRAARQGLGLAVMSRWTVLEDLAAGRLQQVLPQWEATPLPVSIVYPSRRLQPARLRAFVALMREALPRLEGIEADVG
jgi:DNA-binding transcriptional LysR family regulator